MRRLPWIALALALAAAAASGCVMPNGQDVVVDRRAGNDVHTGSAVLLEISDDQTSCRVAVRTNALFVEKRWVDCRYVHARPAL
jgi:hypothetical protein